MFKELIDYFGSRSAMAEALGVSRQAIAQFEAQGYLPAGRAIEVEEISGGKYKAKELIIQQA